MKRLRYAVETAILAVAVMLFFCSLAWLINEHYLRSLFAAGEPGNEDDEKGIAFRISCHRGGLRGVFCRRSNRPVRSPGPSPRNRSDSVDSCCADLAGVIFRPET